MGYFSYFSFHFCPNPACCEDGFGFVDDGDRLRIACPRCRMAIKCRKCEKYWHDEHTTRTCEEFAEWERENSDEFKEGGT